jgi:phenylalanyl-tRNA synthetase beta chain
LAIPTNKVEVHREADIIEEILRIYGFDNVPIPNRIISSAVKSEKPDNFLLKNRIADFLVANSCYEMMGISLSQSRYFTDLIPFPAEELVRIHNTSNTTTDIMRPTMVVSGLEALLHNQNRQKSDVRLFEFGKAYSRKSEREYKETEYLTLFLTGQVQQESWLNTTKQNVDFYALKNLVLKIFQSLGVQNFQESNLSDHPYISIGSKLHRGPTSLAEFGLIAPKVAKGFDLKNEIWYAEINWSVLVKATKSVQTEFQEISKFPTVRRDLALVLDQSVPFGKVEAIAQKVCKKLLIGMNLFDVYKNEEQLGQGKKSYATSFLFEDPERTLQDKEIEKMMQVLTSTLEQQLGAIVRK